MKTNFILIPIGLIILGSFYIFFRTLPVYKNLSVIRQNINEKTFTIRNKKSLLNKLKIIKVRTVKTGSHRLSTYFFTFLSFVSYLNDEGFNISINLKKQTVNFGVTGPGIPPVTPVIMSGKALTIGYYSNYKNMPGIKKIDISMDVKKIPNLMDYLFIFRVLRYMPVIVQNVDISNSNGFKSRIDLEIIGRSYAGKG